MTPPKTTRKVKAWGLLLHGEPAHYHGGEEVSFPATKKEAFQRVGGDGYGYDVVPVTITYSLPLKKAKRT